MRNPPFTGDDKVGYAGACHRARIARPVGLAHLTGSPVNLWKSRQAQKGRVKQTFIALRKPINMEQRRGTLKPRVVAITALRHRHLPVTGERCAPA